MIIIKEHYPIKRKVIINDHLLLSECPIHRYGILAAITIHYEHHKKPLSNQI